MLPILNERPLLSLSAGRSSYGRCSSLFGSIAARAILHFCCELPHFARTVQWPLLLRVPPFLQRVDRNGFFRSTAWQAYKCSHRAESCLSVEGVSVCSGDIQLDAEARNANGSSCGVYGVGGREQSRLLAADLREGGFLEAGLQPKDRDSAREWNHSDGSAVRVGTRVER